MEKLSTRYDDYYYGYYYYYYYDFPIFPIRQMLMGFDMKGLFAKAFEQASEPSHFECSIFDISVLRKVRTTASYAIRTRVAFLMLLGPIGPTTDGTWRTESPLSSIAKRRGNTQNAIGASHAKSNWWWWTWLHAGNELCIIIL